MTDSIVKKLREAVEEHDMFMVLECADELEQAQKEAIAIVEISDEETSLYFCADPLQLTLPSGKHRLYAAPQAKVPEVKLPADAPIWISFTCSTAWATGWNECRNAMIQASKGEV